jgi:NarL family two-component system response regulator LiaR
VSRDTATDAVVIAGVASFLVEERIDVVETGASMPVVSDVDIVLYDTFISERLSGGQRRPNA